MKEDNIFSNITKKGLLWPFRNKAEKVYTTTQADMSKSADTLRDALLRRMFACKDDKELEFLLSNK